MIPENPPTFNLDSTAPRQGELQSRERRSRLALIIRRLGRKLSLAFCDGVVIVGSAH
jgi:hypothetical protein